MANYTTTDIAIRGKLENVATLMGWLEAQCIEEDGTWNCYVKDGDKMYPSEHHFWRCEDIYIYNTDVLLADEVVVYMSGSYAWSAATCLLEYGYYKDYKDEPGNKGTCLEQACKELGLWVEVYSYEEGNEFAEHFMINPDGEHVINETAEYREYPIYDVDTYEEYKQWVEDEGIGDELDYVTEEMFNQAKASNEDYIRDCDGIELYDWNI